VVDVPPEVVAAVVAPVEVGAAEAAVVAAVVGAGRIRRLIGDSSSGCIRKPFLTIVEYR